MKISELIKELSRFPSEFEVEFTFKDPRTIDSLDIRTAKNLEYCDVSWSDGVVSITGDVDE